VGGIVCNAEIVGLQHTTDRFECEAGCHGQLAIHRRFVAAPTGPAIAWFLGVVHSQRREGRVNLIAARLDAGLILGQLLEEEIACVGNVLRVRRVSGPVLAVEFLVVCGHLIGMLDDQGDLGCRARIRDGILHVELTLERWFGQLPPTLEWTAVRVDLLIVADDIHRSARKCKGPFCADVRLYDTGREIPPQPLIGHELPVQKVTIAVEPNITDDIPGFLLSLHLHRNVIGITALERDVGVELVPFVDQLLELGGVGIDDHLPFLLRCLFDRRPILSGGLVRTDTVRLCPRFCCRQRGFRNSGRLSLGWLRSLWSCRGRRCRCRCSATGGQHHCQNNEDDPEPFGRFHLCLSLRLVEGNCINWMPCVSDP